MYEIICVKNWSQYFFLPIPSQKHLERIGLGSWQEFKENICIYKKYV